MFICLSHQGLASSLHNKFKRSTETGDAFKPPDDGNIEPESTALGQSNIEQATPTEQPERSMSFYLPPWLMFFREIWEGILANQAILRMKVPSASESENDLTEVPNTEDGGFQMPEMNSESTNDDALDAGEGASTEWASQDDISELPEGNENILGTTDDAFENPEIDFSSPETSETAMEVGSSDDGGLNVWQPNEVDNTETGTDVPEQDTVREAIVESETGVRDFESNAAHGWIQNGLQGPGSWMQGLANSAMLENPQMHEQINNIGDTPAQSDDAINELPELTNQNLHPAEDIDSHTRTAVFPQNSFGTGGSGGMGFGNQFSSFHPGFLGSPSEVGNDSGTGAPDNERDSSS